MIKRFFVVFCLFFTFDLLLVAQREVNFKSPVDGPIRLAGNFGELRVNHFHTGIDIKTDGVVGKKVYSAEDGYIGRISVSPYGYGKSLYIIHPNGYTTVYGHLLSFRKDIADYVRKIQYSKENFAIDVELPPDAFPVKKGDIVALSGNSGGSRAPHLHFEIRETKSEFPVNPLLFNIPVVDNTKPRIVNIGIFPYNEASFVNGKNLPCKKQLCGSGGNYSFADNDTVKVSGKVYFGINGYDMMDAQSNIYGYYYIKCYFDSSLIFDFQADTHSFDDAICVNSLIDYPTFVKTNVRYYKTYYEPNNVLKFLKPTGNDGLVELTDNKPHLIKYVVGDINHNYSTVRFYIRRDSKYYTVNHQYKMYKFQYYSANNLKFDDFKLEMSPYSLFSDVNFDFSAECIVSKNILSPEYHLGNEEITSYKPFIISIKIGNNISKENYNKLYIALKSGKTWIYKGGTVFDGWISVKTNNFGTYAIREDVTSPVIICKDLSASAVTKVTGRKQIRVMISDNESGIISYYPIMNDKWIIMDYDYKTNSLVYVFDENIHKGSNVFKLRVTDKCGNVKEFVRNILY